MSNLQVVPSDHVTDSELFRQLDPQRIPVHIAMIMDGNGRWAELRGLPRISGHREGLSALREVLDTCHQLGVRIVTIYAFSSENWNRPPHEIELLMNLLEEYLQRERSHFLEHRIRFFPIGQLEKLPASVSTLVHEVAEETRHFTERTLTVALSYGGRAEILDAIQRLAYDVESGTLRPSQIDESLFTRYLATDGLPDPDLLIRTSGETRISNFLLWQIAYTELYFTKTLWPDFRRQELMRAILDYQRRERRFGRVSHSLSRQSPS
ncbi:MAG: isoprenyl transferase [Nitrospirae bacterium]|nr:MAG: isoprenyl transferase [Nitrospirota bacterium]